MNKRKIERGRERKWIGKRKSSKTREKKDGEKGETRERMRKRRKEWRKGGVRKRREG